MVAVRQPSVAARRVGIYLRISQDATGERAGVRRQLEDCTALCAARGWSAERIYEDNDASAYSGKARPAYLRMLDDLRAGDIDAVVAWHPDRLHRAPRELEDFIDVVDGAGAEVATVNGGDYDLTTGTGKMAARIVGAVARNESDRKSERQRRQRLQAAQAGRLHRGSRPFGLTFDGEHVPAERDALRRVADGVLAGRSMRSLAREINELGVTTTKGNTWEPQVLRRTFLSPFVVGQRTYHGEVVATGAWEPLVDELTWRRACAVLNQPGRRLAPSFARKHLLAGFLVCGRCGTRLFSAVVNGAPAYSCKRDAQRTGCGRLTVKAEHVERAVVDYVMRMATAPLLHELYEPVNAPAFEAATIEVGRLRTQRDDLHRARFVDGTVGDPEFGKLAVELDTMIATAERRADEALGATVLAGVASTRDELEAQWQSEGLEWRRALIARYVEGVTVKPAAHKGERFKLERLVIEPRG